MSEPRVKAGLWVSAALRQSNMTGRPGVVVRKGDEDAGGVIAVLRARAGVVVLTQARTGEGALAWLRATGPSPVDDRAADEYIARQTARDPDLWVVEFESPDLTPPFEAKYIS
jgi:hypothetical protein